MQLDDYQNAINDFIRIAQSIRQVDDLLIRGTGGNNKPLIKEWSDLDFSIIVKQLNPKNTEQIRELIRHLRNKYTFKISVTVVTSGEFMSPYHHHGIKPIYYSYQSNFGKSILRGNLYKRKNELNSRILALDCLSHLSYLIHDLRNRNFSRGETEEELSSFTYHLLKRSKHLLTDALFVIKHYTPDTISIEDIQTIFPNITELFLNNITNTKYYWTTLKHNKEELEKIASHTFEQANYIYEVAVKSFDLNK